MFLSYAWEATDSENVRLQQWLKRVASDLRAAGFDEVFLDVEEMTGQMEETMRAKINQSDVISFACTPAVQGAGRGKDRGAV